MKEEMAVSRELGQHQEGGWPTDRGNMVEGGAQPITEGRRLNFQAMSQCASFLLRHTGLDFSVITQRY
jgi:hypothetical protein